VVLGPAAGEGLTQAQCRAATSIASAKVKVPSGEPIYVFIYGPTAQTAQMTTAKIG
jgi:hypothetical protein